MLAKHVIFDVMGHAVIINKKGHSITPEPLESISIYRLLFNIVET